MSGAKLYNKVRRITFSLYHKSGKGYPAAHDFLLSQEGKLSRSAFVGLRAELEFYHNHREEFDLTAAGDFGDHCDFTANIDQKNFRVDVTTNFDYKKYEDYEPFIEDGAFYQIAIVDSDNYELEDLVNINFPVCEECENGRLFDLALLGNENSSHSGSRTWSYDQVHFQYCNNCQEIFEVSRITTVQLPDFDTLKGQISHYAEGQAMPNKELYESIIESELDQQLTNIKNYLKTQFNKIPFGFYSNSYTITNPQTADGFWQTRLCWEENFLEGYVPLEFGGIVIE